MAQLTPVDAASLEHLLICPHGSACALSGHDQVFLGWFWVSGRWSMKQSQGDVHVEIKPEN